MIDRRAALREEIDGLEIEIGEYERVRVELEARIARNKQRAIVARAELEILRASSPP